MIMFLVMVIVFCVRRYYY